MKDATPSDPQIATAFFAQIASMESMLKKVEAIQAAGQTENPDFTLQQQLNAELQAAVAAAPLNDELVATAIEERIGVDESDTPSRLPARVDDALRRFAGAEDDQVDSHGPSLQNARVGAMPENTRTAVLRKRFLSNNIPPTQLTMSTDDKSDSGSATCSD